MTALILINGIPGSGKSTLARDWCGRPGRELSLALDIDALRSMIGGWRHDVAASGRAARAMALAAIATHLTAGHHVVVPQHLRRDGFIRELEHVADRAGAAFVEAALIVDPATALDRFERHRAGAPRTETTCGVIATVSSTLRWR